MGLEGQNNSGVALLQNSLVVKSNGFLMLKIICKNDKSAPDFVTPIPKPFLLQPKLCTATLYVSWALSLPFLKVLAVLGSLGHSFRYGDFQANLPFVLLLLMGNLLPCFYCLLLMLTFYSPISHISFCPPV